MILSETRKRLLRKRLYRVLMHPHGIKFCGNNMKSNTMKKVNLEKIFMNLQKQMIAKLSGDREIIIHPGTKGDASELNWFEMLDTYLPKRYKVDKTFILDYEANLSEQIDKVIYDRHYSPFLFHQDKAIYISSESVYAVFEVKQSVNKEAIEYAGCKAGSVRRLKRTSVPIPHAGGEYEPKEPFEILARILALGSDWEPPLGNSFKKVLIGLDEFKRINLGCVLQSGGFEIKYGKKVKITKSESDEALIFFFMKLLERLQKLATIPAMDISKYGKVFE